MINLKVSTGILGGIVVGSVVYSLTEPFRYIIKRYEIMHPNIPRAFDGYCIAFLADLHYGRTSKERFIGKIVRRVNQHNPDLILLGGDYITHRKYIKPCFEQLGQLKARDGIYGVLGNHDVFESEPESLYHMRHAGIGYLGNKGQWITRGNQRIKIGGVGDLWTQTQDLSPTVADLEATDYSILVTHNPKYIYEIDENVQIGLALAGHTHGGQVKALKYLNKVTPNHINEKVGLEYLSGKYTSKNMDIIVSNGIGTAKIPFRFMTPPEVIIITLRCQ